MKATKLHLFLGLASIVVYLINRFIVKPAIIMNGGVIYLILKNHFNDFLGSFLFCSYCNVLVSFTKVKFKITTIWQYLAIGVLCAVFWEGIIPVFLTRSTADILDCVAYLLGSYCYYMCFSFFGRRGSV